MEPSGTAERGAMNGPTDGRGQTLGRADGLDGRGWSRNMDYKGGAGLARRRSIPFCSFLSKDRILLPLNAYRQHELLIYWRFSV